VTVVDRQQPSVLSFSPVEEAQLRRLVDQAFDLGHEGSPYYIDAVEAIVAWHWQTLPDRLERKARAL
jgi:hypothetical protein